MPAIITHDFFGQDVYNRLIRCIGGTRGEADAFLLGNQGPDPLFYSVIMPRLREHNRLGNVMHSEKPGELLVAFKESLSILEEAEYAIGHAYALGFLCHYTLDSTMHPFVYFHEYELCDAGVPNLTRSNGHEVHAVIESELDEMVLYAKREKTVAEFCPHLEILQASDAVLDVISKMYSYVALTVYGRLVPQNMFAASVRSFRRVQHLFYSPTGIKRAALGRLESLVRPYSFFQSMSHRPIELTESIFDNHAKQAWENPYTGQIRTVGFWDLFEEAQQKADRNIALFNEENFNLESARIITGDLDFSGCPVVATLISVENSKGSSSTCAMPANASKDPKATEYCPSNKTTEGAAAPTQA